MKRVLTLALPLALITAVAVATSIRGFRNILCHSFDNQRHLSADVDRGRIQVTVTEAQGELALSLAERVPAELRAAGTFPKVVSLTSEAGKWLQFRWDGQRASDARIGYPKEGRWHLEDATCEVTF